MRVTIRWQITLLLSVFCILAIFLSSRHLPWSYDEYGALVTHLELQDSAFNDRYLMLFRSICDECALIEHIFIEFILPIFVVPIRWTYALGLSPLWSTVNLLHLDWTLLKPILLLPNTAISALGLWLVFRVLVSRGAGSSVLIWFTAFILMSPPLVWWMNTFSSYANHILCFALLLYTSLKKDNISSREVFGKDAVMRSIVCLFNYQYIPLLAGLFFLHFVTDAKNFFEQRSYRAYIIPFSIAILSFIFLVVRALTADLHSRPTFASIADSEAHLYHLPSLLLSSNTPVIIILERYVNILGYMFSDPSNGAGLVMNNVTLLLLLLSSIFVYFVVNFRSLDRPVILACLAMIAPTVLIHLVGLMPITASRHQLVLFLPFVLLLSIVLGDVFSRNAPSLGCYLGWLALSLGVTLQLALVLQLKPTLSLKTLKHELKSAQVERLILAPCDYEPMLYFDIRKDYDPLYRCGKRIVKRVPPDVQTIAVWSSFRSISAEEASFIVSDYSNKTWIFSNNVYGNGDIGGPSLIIGRLYE